VKLLTIVLITLIILMAALLSVLNAEPVYLNDYEKAAFLLFLLLVLALIMGSIRGLFSFFSIIFRVKRENPRMKKDIKLSIEEISNLRRLPLRDIN